MRHGYGIALATLVWAGGGFGLLPGLHLCSAAEQPGPQAHVVTLAPAGCVVVVSANASRNEAEAARELQKHLGLIAGVELQIAPEAAAGRYPFRVGAVPPGGTEPAEPEEARWRVTTEGAWFWGGERRGAQFAVYDFLEDQLGVRWIEPGDAGIGYREQNPLALTVDEDRWMPDIMCRRIRQGIRPVPPPEPNAAEIEKRRIEEHNLRVADTVRWQARMRMGGSSPGGSHSFRKWWDRYGEAHPEYFALTKEGERAPLRLKGRTWEESKSWAKVCPSNPGVARQVVADWLPYRDRRKYLDAGVNDGTLGFCRCPKCMALDVKLSGERFGDHLTDRYMVLANRVAALGREHRPDAMVAVYAYMALIQPPRKVKLEPNIVVHVVPYVMPMDLQVTEALFRGWQEAGAKHFALRPNYHHKYHRNPLSMGFEEQMFDIFQLARSFGILSANYDSLMHHWPVSGIADYILAKAMSDPSKSFEYWEDHYCSAYGAAAEDVKAYFRYWRQEVWEKRLLPNMDKLVTRGKAGDFGRGLLWSLKYYRTDIYQPEGCDHYYEAADFDKTDEILQQALARDITERDRAKIEQLVLANHHSRLLFDTLTTGGMAKYPHAKELHRFREEHSSDLRLNWGNIGWFERKYIGDGTAQDIVEMLTAYPLPYRETPFQWHFKIDPEDTGVEEKWYELDWPTTRSEWTPIRINVPWSNTYECQGEKLKLKERLKTYDGIGWYATNITVPEEMRGRRVYLYFPMVDESCRVYVNGALAGERICEDPEAVEEPVVVQIDPYVNWKQKLQTVAVRVVDTEGEGGIRERVWIVSDEPVPPAN